MTYADFFAEIKGKFLKAVEEGMLKVEGNVDKALRLQELIESHRS